MSLVFRQAPTVPVGTRPNSTQMIGMANAHNDRLLSGVADWVWRIGYYVVNLWRQPRNPAVGGGGFGLFPSQLEALTYYAAVNPDRTTRIWPGAEAGTNEGANLACVGMAMVFGNPSVESEPERFLDVPLWTGSGAPSVRNLWVLGQMQRGAIDAATGLMGSPVADAAESWQRIVQPSWSPHGKSYGGYLPTPAKVLTGATIEYECGNDEDEGAGLVNYAYRFTALRSDVVVPTPHYGALTTEGGLSVVTYPGSCPCWTFHHAENHVAGIWEGPQAYFTAVHGPAGCNDVRVVRFPLEDWIEGPYEGEGEISHTPGGHLNRMTHAFASDYRGKYEQRTPDTFSIKEVAFPMQEFLARQYQLAPARGFLFHEHGTPYLAAEYPTAGWFSVASIAPGAAAAFTAGPTEYPGEPGYVIAGFAAFAEHLVGSARIDAMDGTTRLGSVTLQADETGMAEAMLWFEKPTRPAALRFVCAVGATFDVSGEIEIEAAELLERKPAYWDAHLVCRLGAAGNGRQVEGRGVDIENAREIGMHLFQNGCLMGNWPIGPDEYEVNTNPRYDAARRLTHSMVRVLARQQFIAYEVAGGKSILYLSRWAHGNSADHLDILEDIAPPVEALGSNPLTEGETYVVYSPGGAGTAVYDGATYSNGQTFTTGSRRSYEAVGDAQLYVHDGIRHTALKRGWTNEWCTFIEPKHYKLDEGSIFKPTAYTDYWPFSDRCHMYAGEGFPRTMIRQFSYNHRIAVDEHTGVISRGEMRAQAALFAPEAPTGYRYIEGSNQWPYQPDPPLFRKSCRVYEPPVAIESATVHDRNSGVIKIVFSTRFHSHEDAPATWSVTPPTWAEGDPKPASVLALETETDPAAGGYRTIDNSLRSYAIHQANTHWNPLLTVGDYGQGSLLPVLGIRPHGAIYPTIFVIKQIPKPYEDGNDRMDKHDTRMTVDALQQCELYQRAGCEGWMDSLVSADLMCAKNPAPTNHGEGHIYDFTWPSLNNQAHGGRWVGSVGEILRPENPEGFGPLPNTKLYADVFNRLAMNVNLLTRARLPIPSQVEESLIEYVGEANVSYTNVGGCGELRNHAAPSAGTLTGNLEYGWLPLTPTGFTAAGWSTRYWAVPQSFPEKVVSTRYDRDIRIRPQPGWEHCIPDALWDLIQSGYGGMMAKWRRTITTHEITGPCTADFIEDHGAWHCGALQTGLYEAEQPAASDFQVGSEIERGAETYTQFYLMLHNQTFVEIPTI